MNPSPIQTTHLTPITQQQMQEQILDIEGEIIATINLVLLLNEIEFEFIKPFYIKDILKGKDKTPEIKIYQDLEIIKEIDFVIYGQELLPEERWAKRQRYSMHLRPSEAPIEKTFKKLIRLPVKHYIEVDINNSKVRLIGAFVAQKEQGVWQEY